MYLLDTNVVSELRRAKPHGAVLAWIMRIPDDQLFISAVTLGEIQTGIEMTRLQNAAKANELENWADQLIAQQNILPMTAPIFRIWAKLVHGRSSACHKDGMIAATAINHRLTMVTRNMRDFIGFDVPVFNPF